MRFRSREERQGGRRARREGGGHDDGVRGHEVVPRPRNHAIIQDVHQGANAGSDSRMHRVSSVPMADTLCTACANAGHRYLGRRLHTSRDDIRPSVVSRP